MADKRITDFTEASTVASDDYLLVDGLVNGSRKIKAKTSVLNNDANFQTDTQVSTAIAAAKATIDNDGIIHF